MGTSYPNSNSVSQTVYCVFAASAKTIVLLVEFVVVIIQITNRDQTFTFVFVQFYIKSPLGLSEIITLTFFWDMKTILISMSIYMA